MRKYRMGKTYRFAFYYLPRAPWRWGFWTDANGNGYDKHYFHRHFSLGPFTITLHTTEKR